MHKLCNLCYNAYVKKREIYHPVCFAHALNNNVKDAKLSPLDSKTENKYEAAFTGVYNNGKDLMIKESPLSSEGINLLEILPQNLKLTITVREE